MPSRTAKCDHLVSVVMPTYNQGRYIREAVESVLAQTHRRFELVIVDDGSTDGTAAYLATIKDTRVRVIRKKNGGTGAALNAGFAVTSGVLETWWASDNVMFPNLLDGLVRTLDAHPAVGHVHGRTEIRTFVSGKLTSTYDLENDIGSMDWDYARVQKAYTLGICWMWRRSLRLHCGEFQTEPCEDYDMVLRMAEGGCRFLYVPEKMGWFRQHEENLTKTIRKQFGAGHFVNLVHEKAKARRQQRKLNGLHVLHINLEFDCAGVSWNLCQAINQHTRHEARHVMHRDTFAAPSTDRRFERVADIMDLVEWADVLHFNQWIWTHRPGNKPMWHAGNEYGTGNPFAAALKTKRVLFHFHGGPHQLAPDYWIRECGRVGATMLKCDPVLPLPGAQWVPNLTDVPEGCGVAESAPFGVSVYGDAGDMRRNNAMIFASLDHAKIPYRAFPSIPRAEAFRLRQQYPVTVDNLTQGFMGMWTWEALTMGAAVVSRVCDTARSEYARVFGEAPPVQQAENVDMLVRTIQRLRDDRAALAAVQQAGRTWAAQHLDPAQLVRAYVDLYEGK
jgi:hypothetical protein